MDMNKFFDSKTLGIIILSIAGLAILVFVFQLGIFVGAKRANFSFRWAESYHKNFAGPAEGFFGNIRSGEFLDANGAFGEIIKIDSVENSNQGSLTIKGADNIERIVLITDKTAIRSQMQDEKLSGLKAGDKVIIIGEPNSEGQIIAQLIRIMPNIKMQKFMPKNMDDRNIQPLPPL
jgi:hypothetical protein